VDAVATVAMLAAALISIGVTIRALKAGQHNASVSPTVPPHVRRGLQRLYVAIAIPWVAWFSYAAYESHSSAKRLQAIYTLFLVPVGGPLLCMVLIWIVAGFRNS
jgi:hypothetical protein